MTSSNARSAAQASVHCSRPPLVFEALSYGPGVREFLSGPRFSGNVVAVFRRALYLCDTNGRMICIVHERTHDAPLTIRASMPREIEFGSSGITIGMQVAGDTEYELHIGGPVVLAMSDAAEWRPAVIVTAAPAARVLRGLRRVSFELGRRAPVTGLAPLVPHVESLVNEKMSRPVPDTGLLHDALPAIDLLVRSMWLRDSGGVDSAVRRLLGLGPGLTPSGDDFLCGFMAAGMATMGASGPETPRSREFDGAWSDVAESISLHAASMTTEVSASFLEFAICGIASSAVHDLIEGLLDADDEPRTISTAGTLTEIGHSSGWDCLLGTLLGMRLCLAFHAGGRATENLEMPVPHKRP